MFTSCVGLEKIEIDVDSLSPDSFYNGQSHPKSMFTCPGGKWHSQRPSATLELATKAPAILRQVRLVRCAESCDDSRTVSDDDIVASVGARYPRSIRVIGLSERGSESVLLKTTMIRWPHAGYAISPGQITRAQCVAGLYGQVDIPESTIAFSRYRFEFPDNLYPTCPDSAEYCDSASNANKFSLHYIELLAGYTGKINLPIAQQQPLFAKTSVFLIRNRCNPRSSHP